MEIAPQNWVLHNNQTWTIGRFLGDIQIWPQAGFLCSIQPKFVIKFVFNVLLFARNSNTNQVSGSSFPLWISRWLILASLCHISWLLCIFEIPASPHLLATYYSYNFHFESIKKGTRRGSKISNSQNGFIPIRKCRQLCSLKPLPRLCCASAPAPALSSSSSLPNTFCGHTYLHSLDYYLVSQKYLFYHVLGIGLAIIHNVSWIKLPICFHA